MPIETFYLTVLIFVGVLTVLFLLFGDFLHGILGAVDFLNPTLIFAFLTFTAASGYLLEKLTSLNHLIIMIVSSLIAIILDLLLNVFVLVPLSSAEESLVYTTQSLKGRVGKVIISIPVDGFGEVVLNNSSGTIAKPAASFDQKPIEEGQKVLVIEVKNGVLMVLPYDSINQFSI